MFEFNVQKKEMKYSFMKTKIFNEIFSLLLIYL
jgi:hypothetical protein